MPGILFDTIAGFIACIVIEKMKEKDTPAYDNYNPGGYIPYFAVSIPIGMLLGYTVGSDVGKYVFKIN